MKVLFICYANVCRSFMAQELLKKAVPEADVFSRGLYADPSYTIPSKVLAFLAEQGITPHEHIPTPLRAQDLQTADLILLMQQCHLDQLADRYAQYSDKMYLLNEFAFGQETDIADPISLSGKAFKKSAAQLAHAVQAVAQKLANRH